MFFFINKGGPHPRNKKKGGGQKFIKTKKPQKLKKEIDKKNPCN